MGDPVDLPELRRLTEAASGYPMGADLGYLEALDPTVVLAPPDRRCDRVSSAAGAGCRCGALAHAD